MDVSILAGVRCDYRTARPRARDHGRFRQVRRTIPDL